MTVDDDVGDEQRLAAPLVTITHSINHNNNNGSDDAVIADIPSVNTRADVFVVCFVVIICRNIG